MPQATVKIRVIPRAKKTQVAQRRGDAFVVRLQAPPVEGAANKALRKFLAKHLGIRAGDVSIASGEKSRDKTLLIDGISQKEAERLLSG